VPFPASSFSRNPNRLANRFSILRGLRRFRYLFFFLFLIVVIVIFLQKPHPLPRALWAQWYVFVIARRHLSQARTIHHLPKLSYDHRVTSSMPIQNSPTKNQCTAQPESIGAQSLYTPPLLLNEPSIFLLFLKF